MPAAPGVLAEAPRRLGAGVGEGSCTEFCPFTEQLPSAPPSMVGEEPWGHGEVSHAGHPPLGAARGTKVGYS